MAIGQPVSVMTFNIRYDNPNDGVNAWPNRIQKVAGVIQTYEPDIVGVQEALKHQLDDMLHLLPNYTYVGVGREDGKEGGEFSAILFRMDRLTLLKDSTRWLSETPEVPGSKSWDAAITRLITYARFYDKQSRREFGVVNTHFDHIGEVARANSARQMVDFVGSLRKNESIPVLVTGDFNCEPASQPYQNLLVGDLLHDTRPSSETAGTSCGFAVNNNPCRTIDYIFRTQEWSTQNYRVIFDNDGSYYPSDHLPVMVEANLR